MPVIALSTNRGIESKLLAGVKEVASRGGVVFAVTNSESTEWDEECSVVLSIPECDGLISALLVTPALQLLGYFAAELRGCDIDKPRNLAKSVTVE